MDKYIIYMDVDGDISEPKKVNCDYEIGDIITKYSYDNQYKCVEIASSDGSVRYYFKQGKRIYTYDW